MEYTGSDNVRSLWRDILGPYYEGVLQRKTQRMRLNRPVMLREILLTDFIPRAPGKFHTLGYTWQKETGRWPFRPLSRPSTDFLIDRNTAIAKGMKVAKFLHKPSFAYPMRYKNKPCWDLFWETKSRRVSLLINARTGKTEDLYDTSQLNERFIERLETSRFMVDIGHRGVVRFGEHNGRRLLTAYSLPDDYGGICPVEFGFPVIMTAESYTKIASIIEKYGCVYAEAILGMVEEIPPAGAHRIVEWASGVPRVGLRVDSRMLIKHPGTPTEGSAASWTAVVHKKKGYYLHCPFSIGITDYETGIKNSVEEMRLELRTVGNRPLFDFDEMIPRFSDAKYGPNYFLARSGL